MKCAFKGAFQSRKGFSLAEISLVFAGLSLLAAISFPTLRHAREASSQSHCASNLRQLGVGWKQYAQDYDGKTLRFSSSRPGKIVYWWGSFDGTTLRTSEGLLRPYLPSARVQTCPSFANNSRAVIGATGYAYNNWYLSPTSFGPAPTYAETAKVVGLSQIQTPSQTVVMADSARLNINGAAPKLESNTYLSPPRYAFPTLHARHNGAANVLWADGHVKAIQPTFRSGVFGYLENGPYKGADFQRHNLGDLDRDGDLKTNELFDLK